MLDNVPVGESRFWFRFLFSCQLMGSIESCRSLCFSVVGGAPAGSGCSGPAPEPAGPEGGVEPERCAGQPEGGAAEPAVQPRPDAAALRPPAAAAGEEPGMERGTEPGSVYVCSHAGPLIGPLCLVLCRPIRKHWIS